MLGNDYVHVPHHVARARGEPGMSTIAPATTAVFRFAAQPLLVRRAAVLGAGTMGSRIAAHLANAGIPSLLLDMVPSGEGWRSRRWPGWRRPNLPRSTRRRWLPWSRSETLKRTCPS